jgi:DNA invertase Pin-like site-specific DNA recombinase
MSEVKTYRDEVLSLLRRANCHYGAALRDEEAGLSAELAARKREQVRMHASGEPVATIAATLGVSRATIYRVLAEETEKR